MSQIAILKRLLLPFIPPILINLYSNQKYKPARFSKANKIATTNFGENFELLEFSLLDVNQPFDLKWGWWSRVFEYELAINKLRKLGANRQSSIHNTCWGYHGSHILFKDELELLSDNVINSDILSSSISNTITYDLRKIPPDAWRNTFDFVVNISTIEEIAFPHIKVLENLLAMVKPGGFLIATFDIPGIQLDCVEKLFQRTIGQVPNSVTGSNSPYQMNEFANLTVGFFVLRKI